MTPELWKRQAWDTSASYRAFADFYLPQDAPRSINQAFRLCKGYPKDAAKAAPGVWRNWAQGKDPKGRSIPGAISWEKRAQAWDDYQKELAFEQETKERLAKRKQRRGMLNKSFYNITAMLDKFDPKQFNPASLSQDELVKAMGQLTNAARIMADQLRIEYDDTPATKVQHSGPEGGPIVIEDARERLISRIDSLVARNGTPSPANGANGR